MGKKKKRKKGHPSTRATRRKKTGSSAAGLLPLLILAAIALAVFLFWQQKSKQAVTSPLATITMENGATIKVELDPENAPNTVRNFIALAGKGFYDGTIFHRVIDGFMIQGGDPEGTGTGGPGYTIKGEFQANGFDNKLKHERGVIAMARTGRQDENEDKFHYDTAGSQFYITVEAQPHLDGKYAVFGKVVEGMEEVDRIAGVATDDSDRPLEDQVIKSITVETFGVEYDPPEKFAS